MMPGRFFLGVGTGENLKEHILGQGWPQTDVRQARLALTVCWGKDEAKARQTARERWPTAAMESSLSWELPLPAHFEAVAELVTEDEVGKYVVCGPDPKRHLEAIQKYADAGYDHVCVHQVGPDQAGFMEFYAAEIFPRLRSHRRKAA